MESEGDRYDIKKFPSIYYYLVLKAAADILFVLKGGELQENKNFKDSCYLWFTDKNLDINKGLLNFIAKEVLGFGSTLNLKTYQGEVLWKYWYLKKIEYYLRFVARLELYGTICQTPQLLKVNSKGHIDLSFLSAWARKVITKAVCIYHNKEWIIHLQFGIFCTKEKDFVSVKKPVKRLIYVKKENGDFSIKKKEKGMRDESGK